MTIIDLLVKIANNEEVPERIRVLGNEFKYDNYDLKYINIKKDRDDLLEHIGFYKGLVLMGEVEIIEDTPEEDKIEKFKVIKDNSGDSVELIYDGMKLELTLLQAIILDKINEIIDKINGGENERDN